MKVTWLIEADIFDDNERALFNEVNKQGHFADITNYSHLDEVDFSKWYKPNDCIVFYGSMGLGRKLQRNTPWVPGVYLNEKAFECTSYYPVIKELLLHHNDYWMLPYGDLVEHKTRIFKNFGDKIFIRPNSGMKEFTGMVLTEDGFYEGIKLAGFYDVDPNLLVLISKVYPLIAEWRFVIVDGTVISGSLYRDWSAPEKLEIPTSDFVLLNSHSLKLECEDNNAWAVAQEAANHYNPDHCWTIDVAKTEYGIYKVLEIGCFSCAGLYGNNLEKVVKAVTNAALDEWKDLNEFYVDK